MNIEEYYKEYMQEIYARAGAEEDFKEEQFLEEMCDFLVDQAVIEGYDSAYYIKKHSGIKVDAWYFNKDKQELTL